MLLSKSDYIIATSSPYLKGSRILRRFEEKCLIVPIGIDSNDFVDNQDLREQLKTDYFGKQVVFSIGRLIYYKGFEYLIKAAKYLPDNIIILIAGEGRLESRLRNLIEELNLNEKVKLIGKLAFDEIAEYYKRCDLFCLPSVEKSEAFGVVQLEAMLHGKAIVSTNIPFSGVPWVNKDNYSGKVVPPANPNALANAITEILRDEKQLKTYGENSRKRYEELFTSEKMGRNIYNIYESLWDRS